MNPRGESQSAGPATADNGAVARGLCAALILCAASTAAADSVRDDIGIFADVKIRGIENGVLVFEFENGRVLTRPLTRVKSVSLSAGPTAGSDELSRGDALMQRKRYEQALPMYQRVRELAEFQWPRDYATFRLIQACDALGRFNDAFNFYMELVDRQPELLAPIPITVLPEQNSEPARKALAKIESTLAEKQNEPRRLALENLRDAILRKKPAAGREPAAGDHPASKGPESAVTPRSAGDAPPENDRPIAPANTVGTVDRTQRASADIYRKLSTGKAADALVAVEKALSADMPDNQRDVWWLAEAEVRIALDQPDRAALAALKVIGLTPDSPYFAEALYTAGRAYEKIRVGRARQFYEDCLHHRTADTTLRRLAEARLKALPTESGDSAP